MLAIAFRALWMRCTIALPETVLTLRSGILPIVSFAFRIQSPPCALVTSPVLTAAILLAACSLLLFESGMRNKTRAADLAPLSPPCSTSCKSSHQSRRLSVDQRRSQEPAGLRVNSIKTSTAGSREKNDPGPGPRHPGDLGPERKCRFQPCRSARTRVR